MEPYSLGIQVKSKDNAQSWQWADCERRANTSHATIYLSFLEINGTETWLLWKTISIKISRKQSQTKEWVNSLPHLLTHLLKLHFFFYKGFTLFFFFNFIYLFIYLWLCWVFVSVQGLSLVAASGGHSSSWCAGLSLSRPLLLRSTGSRRAGSVIVAHGPSCSAARGIFLHQGLNPCPLHWQAESQPLRHQGSPQTHVFKCSLHPETDTSSYLLF